MPNTYSTQILTERQSNPFLQAPAPDENALEVILKAATRVPDHACLSPYRFTICQGQGLDKLTDVFVEATKKSGADEAKVTKAQKMAYRAPMIIVISSNVQEHPKVPRVEQIITAGCAAHAMQMAAFAQGYGAMWRTGDLAHNADVKQALGVAEKDEIIGFLYLGSVAKELPIRPNRESAGFVNYL